MKPGFRHQSDLKAARLFGRLSQDSQAFTHLALINNAVHFELFDKQGVAALQGVRADRIHRIIEVMTGFETHWAILKKTGREGEFRPSFAWELKLGQRDADKPRS